ncbi:YdeI/OmpD-associated family protein [Pseudaestuariivita sp.]|uniref:YdeI/OmpD-associated family protein n=1 Tax=Pseudaestuariivita sp. TaxID=2211669 RepID=UPI00405877B2
MSDYVTFETAIEPMRWGETTYTVLRLPPEVVAALGPAKRVEGEVGEHPVNLAVTKAPVIDDPFLYTGKSFLSETGIAPGDKLEVRLRAVDPNIVEVPRDVMLALRSSGRLDEWEALSPGKRRSLLQPVRTAKRAQTRAKRITALLAAVTTG